MSTHEASCSRGQVCRVMWFGMKGRGSWVAIHGNLEILSSLLDVGRDEVCSDGACRESVFETVQAKCTILIESSIILSLESWYS